MRRQRHDTAHAYYEADVTGAVSSDDMLEMALSTPLVTGDAAREEAEAWLRSGEPVSGVLAWDRSPEQFPCCGGSDERPPEHTQDCSTRAGAIALVERVREALIKALWRRTMKRNEDRALVVLMESELRVVDLTALVGDAPDLRGLLEAVDAVLREHDGSQRIAGTKLEQALDDLAAARKEWP